MIHVLLGMLATCGLALAAPSLAVAEYPSSEKQMKLDDGMTMEQVEALLGKPDRVAQMTCGKEFEAWTCRVWTYGTGETLSVFFRRDKQGWVVNHWA